MAFKQTELLGQLLIQKGLLNMKQLETALIEKERTGAMLGSCLIQLGLISEEDLYQVLSEQFEAEYVKLKNVEISPDVIKAIPAKFATHYHLVPINMDETSIVVAMPNPMDIQVLDDLKLFLDKEIRAVLASESDVMEAIKRYYGIGADTIERITPEAHEKQKGLDTKEHVTEDIVSTAEAASIIKFVNQIFLEAYKDNATDIHVEPYEDELRVRYRIDGILYDAKVPPNLKNFQAAIISRIKVMANLNIAEKRLPQDGRIKIKISGEELDLRVSILPSSFGEAVVIRLLSTNVFIGLKNLGLLKSDLMIFEKLIQQPHGIIFVTGPTGSGKTTTLYAALSKINDSEKKILTIEDPIEYQIKGVIQTQVHPKIGLTFSQGLRSMLRHDPDIMMVGEVRDFETAEITIRIALTGHLVFSTLHTNDAAGGIARLIDMGVEPFLVASSVNAFVAQRLVRVICPRCKVEMRPDREMLNELGVSAKVELSKIKIYKGKGCENCRHIGYKGRTAIYEILVVTDAIRDLILKRSASEQIKNKAIQQNMRTLRQDGWEKIKMGITTPEEVIRVTQGDEFIE